MPGHGTKQSCVVCKRCEIVQSQVDFLLLTIYIIKRFFFVLFCLFLFKLAGILLGFSKTGGRLAIIF